MKEALFSVGIVRDIVQYAVLHGATVPDLCSAIGMAPSLLEQPDQQVSGEVLKNLWHEAVAQTQDEHLGLHIGECFELSAIGIVGYVLLNCSTVEQVLEKLARYTQLFSQGVAIAYTVEDGWVYCDCQIVRHLKNYLLDEPRHPIESTFAALVTAIHQLTGQHVTPYAVWFQHSAPDDSAEHRRFFQTDVQFSQPVNRIVLDIKCLDWPVRSANAALLSLFEQYAEHQLTLLNQTDGYSKKVVQELIGQMNGNTPDINKIAHNLIISVRQLQRQLQAEGTSFQTLVDETRRELALRYLQNSETAIYDIAFLLGFSEPSAFNRAFKRWTGKTPRTYREATIKSPGANLETL